MKALCMKAGTRSGPAASNGILIIAAASLIFHSPFSILHSSFRAWAAEPLVNPPALLEPPPARTEEIDFDQTLLRRLEANPNTLNPLLAGSAPELAVLELVNDPLVVFDHHMQWAVNPAVVESYEESADHLTVTLVLKDGLKWQDGRPFTARDVVFSWQQLCDPKVPAGANGSAATEIAACEALDARTVKLVHREASPVSRLNLRFPIVPQHLFEPLKNEDPTLAHSEKAVRQSRSPVGNGPYRFVEWLEGERIVLERWDGYPGPRPAFKRVVFRILRDEQAALLAMLKGEIDEMRLSPAQFSAEINSPEFARVAVAGKADQWQINYIGWNMDGSNSFFGDARVRRAMTHALDVDQVLQSVYSGLYSRAVGIYPSGSWMFNSQVAPLRFDPAEAASLLDAAGWKLDREAGWRTKDGITFAFELLCPQESATGRQVLTYYQQALRSLGVDMKVRLTEFATLRELRARHEFAAFYGAWTTSDDPDQDRGMWQSAAHTSGANYVGYKSERVDALFEEARRTFDPERRRQCYRDIHGLIHEDQPFTFISVSPTLWAFNKHLRGVAFSPRGVFYWHPGPRNWWVKRGDTLRASN